MSSNTELVINDHKIILSIIPKVSCSSISEWYVREIVKNKDYKITPIGYLLTNKCYKNIFDYHNYKGYIYYLFIRDPVDRCISCFINKFVLIGKQKINYTTLEPFIKNLLTRYNYTSITFNDFLDIIEQELNNNIFPDPHIRNQIDFYKLNGIKENCNLEVVKIDKISEVLTDLSSKMNITPSYDYTIKTNASTYTDSEYVDITNIPCFDIKIEHLNKNNFKSAFPRILEIYKKDVEFFNQY
jgi:hypothetical protein